MDGSRSISSLKTGTTTSSTGAGGEGRCGTVGSIVTGPIAGFVDAALDDKVAVMAAIVGDQHVTGSRDGLEFGESLVATMLRPRIRPLGRTGAGPTMAACPCTSSPATTSRSSSPGSPSWCIVSSAMVIGH